MKNRILATVAIVAALTVGVLLILRNPAMCPELCTTNENNSLELRRTIDELDATITRVKESADSYARSRLAKGFPALYLQNKASEEYTSCMANSTKSRSSCTRELEAYKAAMHASLEEINRDFPKVKE